MPIIRKPDLTLSGLQMPGTTVLYDQLAVVAGNHLRWNFNPELGFPPGGFTVSRGTMQNKPAVGDPYTFIFDRHTTINLPANATEALNRILNGATDVAALRARFQVAAGELVNILLQLKDPANPLPMYLRAFNNPQYTGLKSKLRMLDSVLIACLDPYIARMVGLYYIDSDIRSGVTYGYKVTGHWGAVTCPLINIDFINTPLINQAYQALQFDAVKVIAGARTIGIPSLDGNDLMEKHLLVHGEANPVIKMHFDFPVEEVIINNMVWNTSGIRVTAPVWGLKADGVNIPAIVTADTIHIKRPGNPFQRLEVNTGPAGTWRIFSMAYRKKINAIGDLASPVYITPGSTPSISMPPLVQLTAGPMPLILDNNGYVNPPVSQVSLSALAALPAIQQLDVPPGITEVPSTYTDLPGYPVRLMFGRSASATTTPQTEISIVNGIYSPALYRERINQLTLPDLVGYWPFNGDIKNSKNGIPATMTGNARFTKHTDDASRLVLKLSGDDAIRLVNQPELKELGSNFTLEATIMISATNAAQSTLIGNNAATGFWLGLIRQSNGTYLAQACINGRAFNSITPIPVDEWTKISVSYNGHKVRFHVSHPTFTLLENDLDAVLGRVTVPAGDLIIGAETSTSGSYRWYFSGYICHVCIWQRNIHPLESNKLIKEWEHFLPQQQSTAELIHYDTSTYLVSASRDQVLFEKSLPIKALGTSFSIFLWTSPLPGTAAVSTLLGNKRSDGWWLGLVKTGDLYRIRLALNGRTFDSAMSIQADRWSHVGFMYTGTTVQFFVNGLADSSYAAALGALNNNDLAIGIGSDTGAVDVAGQLRYNGFINGIQIWRKAIPISQWHQKMAAVQHVDKFLPNARHYYFVKGVDLFGRAGNWSASRNLLTNAQPDYNSPLNVHAAFTPISATITAITATDRQFECTTDWPFDAAVAERMPGYDVIVSREMMYAPNEHDVATPQKVEQLFEIEQAVNLAGMGKLVVKKVPFTQLVPQVGDRVTIQLDHRYQVKWVWTGMQQLYYPSVTRFKMYRLTGHMNEIVAPVSHINRLTETTLAVTLHSELGLHVNELAGRRCLVGPHSFTIRSHGNGADPVFNLHYAGMPAVTPVEGDLMKITLTDDLSLYVDYDDRMYWSADPVTMATGGPEVYTTNSVQTPAVMNLPAVTLEELREPSTDEGIIERQQLMAKGVDWLPLSDMYKIVFPQFTTTNNSPGHPRGYVPGAFVFFDKQLERNRWRAFYVLWHEWAGDGVALYVLPGEKGEMPPIIEVSPTYAARLYAGKQYQWQGNLPALPEFDPAIPTQQYHIALTAIDDAGRESALSRKAAMVAVNRKRPGEGPKPVAVINEKADYYNNCKVQVQWPAVPGQGILYKLYRATDSAVYTRDLEQRRSRQGYYRVFSDAAIFADDADFNEWLQTITPAIELHELFAPKDSPAWQHATPVWRKWADRFYPALNNLQLQAIAIRAGNEKAFSLLNGKPTAVTDYIDTVNGVVSNRYYYRLRLVNSAGAESSTWGALSEPVVAPGVMAPVKPVFSKIEAGDRQIILHWSLNREPDLKSYRLYRADTKEALNDLRWWRTDDDPRIIAHITDPRIKTSNRGITLPGSLPIADISGVYRAGEFDRQANPATLQPHAYNYFRPVSVHPSELPGVFIRATDAGTSHVIQNLRRIEDGSEVVIVFRDNNGDVQTLFYLHNQFPFCDQVPEGLKDYFYRVMAVNEAGRVSVGSDVKRARATDKLAPEQQEWNTVERRYRADGTNVVSLAWIINDPAVRCIVQRRGENQSSWVKASEWLIDPEPVPDMVNQWLFRFEDENTIPGKGYSYRVKLQSQAGNINKDFNELYVEPLAS